MARFVSKYLNYSHGVQDEVAEVFARGKRVIDKHLEAKFGPQGLTEEDILFALDKLPLHGLPEDRDTGQDLSGRSRLSVFDSALQAKENKWTPDEEDLVVKILRESDQYGLVFIEVVPQPAATPWPSYDTVSDLEQILAIVEATNIPAEKVIAYEQENLKRSYVIAALEELVPESEADEVVTINAA